MVISARMTASPRLAGLALTAALVFGAGDAHAARALLHELMVRVPAAESAKPALPADKLEACMRTARDLDKTGVALDEQISEVERVTAEAMFLQYQLNMKFPRLDGGDENAMADFSAQSARHDALSRQFKEKYEAYQARDKSYQTAVAAFERDCAGNFTRADLDAAKTKLQIK